MNWKREIMLIGTVIVLFSLFAYIFTSASNSQKNFLRGQNGKYCYEVHDYPHQIRNFCYYNTYEECEKNIQYQGQCNANDK